ncbi:MAG: flagellar biosynthetic protein FliO [Zoogloeaceae bacterium]|jgi:flagellar protein FliO/FliZ|nr:flagellar biosynthetic protein FliO [Zoogloeaceae bacterium]
MRSSLFFLLALPGLALAAESPEAQVGVSSGTVLQVFLMLGLIVGFLVLLAWMGRKFLGGKGFGQGGLKLLGGVALGPRERIVLLEAGDQWLVVGVVPGQIRTLHTMPRGAPPSEASANGVPLPPLTQSFAHWLQKFSKPPA